ncbi:DUF4136 domain-containing protein [Novosphingobium rosa]|uniref:DUF4136 domain-containing protein n=1 Tax=Novosphingobium rosa TaxID=76978 RepID=UPI00082DF738|nr:DUF4136 domain-containing protein [Novosphingobium rosa]
MSFSAHPTFRLSLSAAMLALSIAGTASAQPGWGGYGGGYGGYGGGFGSGFGGRSYANASPRDDREGKLDAEGFPAPDAGDLLGSGHVTITAMAGSMGEGREEATFEAAVIDQLAKSGYDTVTRDPNGGQITEIGIIHDELVPAEQKHSPLSGEAAVGVSNYGSGFGVALNYDASKPRGALIETRLDLRIRDRATGKPLFEGRARIATREGDSRWTDEKIANRLAAAIFAKFPQNPHPAPPATAPAPVPAPEAPPAPSAG